MEKEKEHKSVIFNLYYECRLDVTPVDKRMYLVGDSPDNYIHRYFDPRYDANSEDEVRKNYDWKLFDRKLRDYFADVWGDDVENLILKCVENESSFLANILKECWSSPQNIKG